MRDQRGAIILASICSVLNKIWDLAPPVLIGMAIDVVHQQEESFRRTTGTPTHGCSCRSWLG